MSRALQVFYSALDDVFLKLSAEVRHRIEAEIDNMGGRLGVFPHYRMTGGQRYRLHVGDYRVIYTFDVGRNEIHLLAMGHRREVYR